MEIAFPFEKKPSIIFKTVHRPIAPVWFWSKVLNNWSRVLMVVDTGADYTMLPRYWANNLGINLEKEGVIFRTSGVGGQAKTFFVKSWKIKLGNKEMFIPLGFLDQDNIPPLFGRQDFMEKISVTFKNRVTAFEF